MRTALVALAAISITSAVSANSFTNGSFELNGGAGQLNYGPANSTTLTGWSVPNGGYTFVTTAELAATGTPNSQFGGNISWWSTQNGGLNTITASPDGGYFVAIDGAYEQEPLQQIINGLTIGKTYTTTFYWALAQQNGFTGPTTDNVQVSLGNSAPVFTDTKALASHDF
jgi:hypothetical protein